MSKRQPTIRVFVSDATRRWAHDLDDLRDRWQIRREVATEQAWMPVLQFSAALDGLDDRALQDLKLRLLEIRNQIKKALDDLAHQHHFQAASGKDPEGWQRYNEMNAALDSARAHLLAVHDAQGRVGRAKKQAAQREWERQFVEAAKELLPPAQFDALKHATHQRLKRLAITETERAHAAATP